LCSTAEWYKEQTGFGVVQLSNFASMMKTREDEHLSFVVGMEVSTGDSSLRLGVMLDT
jgi:hypothetical protein